VRQRSLRGEAGEGHGRRDNDLLARELFDPEDEDGWVIVDGPGSPTEQRNRFISAARPHCRLQNGTGIDVGESLQAGARISGLRVGP